MRGLFLRRWRVIFLVSALLVLMMPLYQNCQGDLTLSYDIPTTFGPHDTSNELPNANTQQPPGDEATNPLPPTNNDPTDGGGNPVDTTPTPLPPARVNCNYFVAPNGNNSWSGRLPAVNTYRTDGPLATFDRARDLVGGLIRSGMSADLIICFRGGHYYLNQTVAFGAQDSGRNGFRVIYRAYPNEEPIFHAGAPLQSGWMRTTRPGLPSAVYQISVPTGLNIHTMYDGHRRVIKARYPNTSYLLAGEPTHTPYQTFTHRGDIPSIAGWAGLQVVIWPNGNNPIVNWYERIRNVEAITASTRVITLENAIRPPLNIGRGARYYLQGRPEFLDTAGEFYYDRPQGTLYYYPLNGWGDPNGRDIYAPSFVTMISLRGTATNPVQNITFDSLTFYHGGNSIEDSTNGAIDLNGGTEINGGVANIRIENCRLEHVGSCGVAVNGTSSGTIIRNTLFQDIGYYGIYMRGLANQDISHEHVINNNRLIQTGRLVGHGDGIFLESVSRTRISRNLLYDTRRHSIEITATMDGSVETNHTRNNIVEFNDVSEANTDSEDTGLIYLWGYTSGTVIRNNLVHDSQQLLEEGYGIYLDGWTDGSTVENNIICNIGNQNSYIRGALMAHGTNHRFVNNVVKNNTVRTRATWGAPTFGAVQLTYNRGVHGGHIFERNIFYRTGEIQYSTMNYDNTLLVSVNHNLYWGHAVSSFARWKTVSQPLAQSITFPQWQSVAGFDRQSLVANPRFVNEQGCDVTLADDSPAFVLGFHRIDTSLIGLSSQFPFECTSPTSTICVRRPQQ